MKKYLIITLMSLATTITASAQDYKVNKTSGKLIINLPSVTVEGYSGNEVVFSSREKKASIDPRAKGLRAINGSGFTDNTDLGISVVEKGTNLEVNAVAAEPEIKILVPKGLVIVYECHKMQGAGKAYFKNLTNEIETSTDYNEIELENVTGPLSVRALYGSVDAKFNAAIKGAVSLNSIYSDVDITIPTTSKVNVKLSTQYGSILASAELKIEMEKNTADDMINYGSKVNGKLNGGGVEFKLSAEYGKIYLRASK